jgi:aminomethyltransferase
MISRTGYTGEDGFEVILWLGQEDVQLSLWRAIMDNMEDLDGLPCGLGARDTLRIEAGYCLYGNDLTDEITPWEADLGWVVKLEQGEFIGKDALERKKGEEGRIRWVVVLEEGIPRHGHRVLSESDEEIGVVTSGTFSPLLQDGIGFVYVDTKYAADGEIVYVDVRGKRSQGRITGFPFYDTDVYGASRKN